MSVLLENTQALRAIKQLVQRWREHHARHRLACMHQRNVDREFTIAFDELFGAVERIDQKELFFRPIPVLSRLRYGLVTVDGVVRFL